MKAYPKVSVTVLIAVKNEAANLPKCLASLTPARKIMVLDSKSTDATSKIAKKFGAQVVQFRYSGGYPKKRQWALENLKISTDWTLLIDADEEVPETLWREITEKIQSKHPATAYLIRKQFHFLGKKFRFGGFSFVAVLLFRTGKARFEKLLKDSAGAMDMEVHERLIVEGTVGKITDPLVHNDFKGLEAYLDRHNKYSTWEARLRTQFLQTGTYGEDAVEARLFGNAQERRRWLKKIAIRVPGEPCLWFFYHYFFKLGFLEGKRGWIACRIRANYIFQVRAKMAELSMKRNGL